MGSELTSHLVFEMKVSVAIYLSFSSAAPVLVCFCYNPSRNKKDFVDWEDFSDFQDFKRDFFDFSGNHCLKAIFWYLR